MRRRPRNRFGRTALRHAAEPREFAVARFAPGREEVDHRWAAIEIADGDAFLLCCGVADRGEIPTARRSDPSGGVRDRDEPENHGSRNHKTTDRPIADLLAFGLSLAFCPRSSLLRDGLCSALLARHGFSPVAASCCNARHGRHTDSPSALRQSLRGSGPALRRLDLRFRMLSPCLSER